MIEVFKTNVENQAQAKMLVEEIHQTFMGYKANFDLDDCDNILRVVCTAGFMEPDLLIDFLKSFGYNAQVLPDELSVGTTVT
jgi:hypothetical protein